MNINSLNSTRISKYNGYLSFSPYYYQIDSLINLFSYGTEHYENDSVIFR